MGKLLSIDLGTTYFKLSLFDRDGRLGDTVRVAPPIVAQRDGWMELSADAFGRVIAQGIADLRDRVGGDLSDVEAVSFATQTNSFLLLDSENAPLTPLILWPDRRAMGLEAEVHRRCNVPDFASMAGFPKITFQCMPAKLLWLQRQSPELWKKTKKICLISDYLTLLFTGKHVTEAGAMGLTGFVDIHRCQWMPEVLARFEIDEPLLPRIVRAGEDLGPIDPQAAQRFGLPASCRFVVGCLDQYAGPIGVGNVAVGMMSETTGTVLASVQCADRFSAELGPGVLHGPSFREGLYWRMIFGETSANCLQWYREQLPDRPEFDKLVATAETVEPGAAGLKLNVADGLSTVEKVFVGLTARHSQGYQVRCILEAVAFALNDQMTKLSDGSLPGEIRCAGGAARSDLWLQIKADVLGIGTTATACPEPTSLGAAILAHATLCNMKVEDIARQWVRLKPPHLPDSERHRQYQKILAIYQA